MHRSNPLALASGLLFIAGLGLLWYVSRDFPLVSKLYFGIAYCAAASVIGFWMWQHGQRLARIIEDIPTSRIASAPQGYVELLGQACELADMSLVTGLSGTPCLWYRWQIARRGGEGHGNDLVATLISHTVYIPDEHEESQSCIGVKRADRGRHQGHLSGEEGQRLAGVHGGFRIKTRKPALFGNRRSNRHHPSSLGIPCQSWLSACQDPI